uniref:Uncharacterized protein n=1 Tax=Zea mays TaxID=4577 RepID=B7ZXS7_MAIZE|nr:unknown [Zea mays]
MTCFLQIRDTTFFSSFKARRSLLLVLGMSAHYLLALHKLSWTTDITCSPETEQAKLLSPAHIKLLNSMIVEQCSPISLGLT